MANLSTPSSTAPKLAPAVLFLALFAALLGWCQWSPAFAPPPPPPPAPPPFIELVPGEAAGQISIGMTLQECERILGPANLAENVDDGQLITWRDMNVSVQMAKGGHPSQPSEAEQTTNIVADILVRSDRYATDSRVRVGCTVAEVQKAFGPTENHNGLLSYPAQGINFLLEGDKVTEIIIFPKSGNG